MKKTLKQAIEEQLAKDNNYWDAIIFTTNYKIICK